MTETDEAARLEQDGATWDAFVADSAQPTHLQTTAWAAIKRANGWRAIRVVTQADDGMVGAQILVRRARGLPWGLGYVPRGPIGGELSVDTLATITDRLREAAKRHRLAYVTMEPELPPDAADDLRAVGWRPALHIQPDSTRIIDLDRPTEEIWNDVHRKARQSVNKARRNGIRVVEADGDRLDDFHRIHAATAVRTHIIPRAMSTFRLMWDALRPRGMARLFFAEKEEGGEAVATLFLVSCGPRVVDLYGGTTPAGDATRANYVLKWEAIERCREAGFKEYDLWGLPRAGIAQFKASWGGREVHYVGAWELPTSVVGRPILRAGLAARSAYVGLRYGRAPTDEGAD